MQRRAPKRAGADLHRAGRGEELAAQREHARGREEDDVLQALSEKEVERARGLG